VWLFRFPEIHGISAADARAGKLPLEAFVITKGLNKSPQD
jgi:hypothetical protein